MLIWMVLSFVAGLLVGPEWIKTVYTKLNHWYNLTHNHIVGK